MSKIYLLLISICLIFSVYGVFSLHENPHEVFAAACPTNDLSDSLITAYKTISGLGNIQGVCFIGAPAYIPTDLAEYRVDNFRDLLVNYYNMSNSSVRKPPALNQTSYFHPGGPRINIAQNTLFYSSNSLTIGPEAILQNPGPNNGVGVFFIEGDLNITGNIDYGDQTPGNSFYTDDNSQSGLVFIVKGQINIARNVRQINAVLISQGVKAGIVANPHTICTACDSSGTKTSSCTVADKIAIPNTCDAPLTINGSLASLDPNINIQFARKPLDTSTGAELINAQPKYLVILKDIISATLRIQTEL